MTLVGLADFGEDRTEMAIDGKADYGLVFIFQPLMVSYTQPIAVSASNGPTHGNKLAQLVIQAVVKLKKAGAIVHGVISDGATCYRKMWTELGANAKMGKNFKNYFDHPFEENRKVFLFADSPHLMKNVRNRMYGAEGYGALQVDKQMNIKIIVKINIKLNIKIK